MCGYDQKQNIAQSYSLPQFAQLFDDVQRQALLTFDRLIVGELAIPYKIKNKNFLIEVAATTAFTLNIVFRNVLIEDGRHPLEIVMDHVRIEKTGEMYRLRFVNMLQKDDPLKESAFVFESLEIQAHLWNYNFFTQLPSQGADKLPWFMLDEPLRALLAKAYYLGESCLNDYEKAILPAIGFLDIVFQVFLDPQTHVGYGKSNIYFDKDVLAQVEFEPAQMKAGIEVFEKFGWEDLKQKFLDYKDDRTDFFCAMMHRLTDKSGKILYMWLTSHLTKATCDYPRLRSLLPIYAGRRQLIKNCIDQRMQSAGFYGNYPHYQKLRDAAFVEVSQVYERKYTYINAKKKLELISYIESVVDGCLTLTAVKGTIIGEEQTDLCDPDITAIDGCFSDQGRRQCFVADMLTVSEALTEDDIRECIKAFVRGLVK